MGTPLQDKSTYPNNFFTTAITVHLPVCGFFIAAVKTLLLCY